MLLRVGISTVVLLTMVSFANAGVKLSHNDDLYRGGTYRVICTVTGEQFDGWYGPKGKITTDRAKSIHMETIDASKKRLVIASPDGSDGGVYTCKGSKASAKYTLSLLVVSTPDGNAQVLQLHQTGVIRIDAGGYPTPSFVWKKDDQKIDVKGRYSVRADGSLVIKDVQASDQGNYTCSSSIYDGRVEEKKEFDVKVYETAKITKHPKKDRYATEGYNITFVCEATGFPTVTYTWKNPINSVIKTFGRYHVDKGILTIENVQPSDKGRYTCEVTSGDGKIQRAVSEIVNILVKPEISVYPDRKEIEVAPGKELRLECKVIAGSLPVNIRWTREGKEYEMQQKVGSDTTVINIDPIRVLDGGLYVCEAYNGAQDASGNLITVTKSIQVQVISKPVPNTILSPSAVYSFLGNELVTNIRCNFYGFPPPEVTIYDNRNYKVGNGTQEAVLRLYTNVLEMFSTYRCYGENIYGNANHTITLKFAEPPSEPRNLYTNATCNLAMILWDEPAKDGGMPVTEYVVGYGKDREDEVVQNVDGQTDDFTIPGLNPETTYKYSVKAFNRAHTGLIARGTIKTTKYCRPSRPSIVEPEAEMLEDTKFTLKWRAPKDNGGDPEITYKVRYTPYLDSGELGMTLELETPELEVLIVNLDMQTKYKFEVVAVNRGGESDPAIKEYQVPSLGARTSRSCVLSASLPLMATAMLSCLMRRWL